VRADSCHGAERRFRGDRLPGFCEALIRKYDYDRYLAALFVPEAVRADLFALYAFNHEIAKIAEMVRTPIAGQIRLQWWRDAIAEIFSGAAGGTEVLQALAAAIRRHELGKEPFDRILDARERDLEEAPFPDIGSMELYADETSGVLMRLAADVLGAGDVLDGAAHEAGQAYAITGLLRALPFHASRSRIVMPADEMEKAGVPGAQISGGEMTPNLSLLIGRIAEVARIHYDRVAATDRRFLPAILPAALVPGFLRVLSRPGFNPFRDTTGIAGYRRQLIMLRAMARRHI
jgi:phytoene/squalene synthetase